MAAVRAMEAPGKVVIWEPLEDVAHAACEVWGPGMENFHH